MKLSIIYILLIISCQVYAQDKPETDSTAFPTIKKDLLLTVSDFNSSQETGLKERFLNINNTDNKNNSGQGQDTQEKPQSEGFKISSGVLYFAGAAVLAAVIYFLVPDNNPSSKPVSTFGIPVTPK